MSSRRTLRTWLGIAGFSALTACSDTNDDKLVLDASPPPSLPSDHDAGAPPPVEPDAEVPPPPPVPLRACVDRPAEVPRPPTGELPCELLPPGFSR